MSLYGTMREGLASDIDDHFGLYIGLLVLYTIGATAGSFTVMALPAELSAHAKDYLRAATGLLGAGPSIFPVLLHAFAFHLFVFFLITLASVKRAFLGLGVAAIAFTGLAAGFASRMLIVVFGTQGALLSIGCIWLSEAIFFPCRTKGLQLAVDYRGCDDPNRARLQYGLCIAIACLGVFAQCLLAPCLLRQILF